MKHKLYVRLQGCNKELLDDMVKHIRDHKIDELNFTKDLDGGYVNCKTTAEIIGKDVIMNSIYEGKGQEFEETMAKLKSEILSGEFQRSIQKEFKPEDKEKCNKVIVTYELIRTY